MPYYLSKILPDLVMPLSVAVAATVLALIFVFLNRRGPAILCLLIAISVLWLASLPAVAGRLFASLQGQYLPLPLQDIPVSDCIVVLGGALGGAGRPRVDIELTDATDRVYQTAKLYRAGKAKTVIVAAGNQPWAQARVPEARLIGNLLVEWGVLRQAIVLDTASKNTRENAVNASAALRAHDCRSNLLVTSAWHMPRALATFRKIGIEMYPVSVDIMSLGDEIGSISSLIPRANALATTSLVIKEWLGIWVYRMRDWA